VPNDCFYGTREGEKGNRTVREAEGKRNSVSLKERYSSWERLGEGMGTIDTCSGLGQDGMWGGGLNSKALKKRGQDVLGFPLWGGPKKKTPNKSQRA